MVKHEKGVLVYNIDLVIKKGASQKKLLFLCPYESENDEVFVC